MLANILSFTERIWQSISFGKASTAGNPPVGEETEVYMYCIAVFF